MTKNPTYFVDIDGTLVLYRKFDELRTTPAVPILSVVNKVNEEYENGAHIVITSARPDEFLEFTKAELISIGVKYHQIILGIGRGTRYIINDKDPEFPDIDRAVGINLTRNSGLL